VLDYDGALMAHQPLAQLLRPSEGLLAVLHLLCEDPSNTVIVTTGRKKSDIEEWFHCLPRLGIIADHGYWIRAPRPKQTPDENFFGSGQIGLQEAQPHTHLELEQQGRSHWHGHLHCRDDQNSDDVEDDTRQSERQGIVPRSSLHGEDIAAREALPLIGRDGSNKNTTAICLLPIVRSEQQGQRTVVDLQTQNMILVDERKVHRTNTCADEKRSEAPTDIGGAGDEIRSGVMDEPREAREQGRGDSTDAVDCNCGVAPRPWHLALNAEGVDLSWMDEIMPILQDFTQRTPGSVIERTECCLTWHYRDSDGDFGISQAKNLQLQFGQMLQRRVRTPIIFFAKLADLVYDLMSAFGTFLHSILGVF
jgi:hypothetical protein